MNDSRVIESCVMVSVCPSPPNTTSWCATRPGSRTEWIGSCTLPAGLARSARRCAWRCPTARRAFGRGEAPRSRTRACAGQRASRPPSSGRRRSRSWEPRTDLPSRRPPAPRSPRRSCPSTQWTPASRHARALASAESGCEKSTTTSASPSTSASEVSRRGSARPTSCMSSAASTASQTASPIRPGGARDCDRGSCRRDERGVHVLERPAEHAVVRSHAGG